MDPDKEAKRRKSIAYILRRRKRGRRVGGNSHQVVKSWAEYGEVNFTPSGSYSSGWRRWIWVLAVPLAIFAPVIIAAASQDNHRLAGTDGPLLLLVLLGLLAIVSAGVIGITGLYVLTHIWRLFRRD